MLVLMLDIAMDGMLGLPEPLSGFWPFATPPDGGGIPNGGRWAIPCGIGRGP